MFEGGLFPVQMTDDRGTQCYYHNHPHAARFVQWREAKAANPYLSAQPKTAAQFRAHAALQEELSEDYARRQKPAGSWYTLALEADRRAVEYLRRAKVLELGQKLTGQKMAGQKLAGDKGAMTTREAAYE